MLHSERLLIWAKHIDATTFAGENTFHFFRQHIYNRLQVPPLNNHLIDGINQTQIIIFMLKLKFGLLAVRYVVDNTLDMQRLSMRVVDQLRIDFNRDDTAILFVE